MFEREAGGDQQRERDAVEVEPNGVRRDGMRQRHGPEDENDAAQPEVAGARAGTPPASPRRERQTIKEQERAADPGPEEAGGERLSALVDRRGRRDEDRPPEEERAHGARDDAKRALTIVVRPRPLV